MVLVVGHSSPRLTEIRRTGRCSASPPPGPSVTLYLSFLIQNIPIPMCQVMIDWLHTACQGRIFIESSQNVFPNSFLPPLNHPLHFRTVRMNFFNVLSLKLDQPCFMHVFIRGTADLNEKWLFLVSACIDL